MPHDLTSSLAKAWPPAEWQDVSVIVAVSGGRDSTALLCLLHELKTHGEGRLQVGHFNHGLRAASKEDEAFVGALCERLDIPCHVGRADVAAAARKQGDGIESAARDVRYAFLRELAEREGARFIATAHTADDQVETILHRILRGTGLTGLSGMPRCRNLSHAVTLIRPMLDVPRSVVEHYLAARGQAVRDDASNTDLRFTRNRIRHELLPQLARDYNANVDSALLRLGRLAAEAQAVIDGQADQLMARLVRCESPDRVTIDCAGLANESRTVVREVLVAIWRRQDWPRQAMGFEQWETLASLVLDTAPCDPMFPGAIAARRDAGVLTLSRT